MNHEDKSWTQIEWRKCYGAAIRKFRRQCGFTQKKFGVDIQKLRLIEQGKRPITTADIILLAKAHSLTPAEYLRRIAQTVGRLG